MAGGLSNPVDCDHPGVGARGAGRPRRDRQAVADPLKRTALRNTGAFQFKMTAQVPEGPLLEFVSQRSPLGRLGEQELDAALLVFLASTASSYITGSTLPVDGGMSGH
ncbi:SDR family oxidoreductase [Actinomycetospora aeridis]|uniref:SDR family oxidoreductase n=1 Tax=Actinomycetospora aeridis TaxID=3129231 RepID=A0ABU8MYL6_9PSEU